MNVNTNVPPLEGACREYIPFSFVAVPFVVPFNNTFTPESGLPSSAEVTFPVMVLAS
jgi:hypothetical protein